MKIKINFPKIKYWEFVKNLNFYAHQKVFRVAFVKLFLEKINKIRIKFQKQT